MSRGVIRSFVFSVLLTAVSFCVMPQGAYAQNFDVGLDLATGVSGDKQATVGAGLSIGLLNNGPIRIGLGFGGATYPFRPKGDLVQGSSFEHHSDYFDTFLYLPFGLRVYDNGLDTASVYLSFSYMRMITESKRPGLNRINNGFMVGFTLSTKLE